MKKHGAIKIGGGVEVSNPWFSRQVKKRRAQSKAAKAARKKNR